MMMQVTVRRRGACTSRLRCLHVHPIACRDGLHASLPIGRARFPPFCGMSVRETGHAPSLRGAGMYLKMKKMFFPFYCARLIVPLDFVRRYSRSAIKMKKMFFPFYCARLIVPLDFVRRYSRSAIKMKKNVFSFLLRSLNRTVGLRPKVLTLGHKNEKKCFFLFIALA